MKNGVEVVRHYGVGSDINTVGIRVRVADIQQWMMGYNEERPHESLGDLTPVEYRAQRAASPEML